MLTHSFLGDRSWSVQYQNDLCISADSTISIIMKTRNDAPATCVPEEIYSSLKYETSMIITPGPDSLEPRILLAKVQLIHENEAIEELYQTGMNGITDGSLTTDISGKYSWKTKLSFRGNVNSLDDYFHLQVCIYQPEDLMRPVLVLNSADFHILPRRTVPVSRKRGLVEQCVNSKRSKCSLDEYLDTLDALMKMQAMLSEKDKQKASFDLQNRLIDKTSNQDDSTFWYPTPAFSEEFLTLIE